MARIPNATGTKGLDDAESSELRPRSQTDSRMVTIFGEKAWAGSQNYLPRSCKLRAESQQSSVRFAMF